MSPKNYDSNKTFSQMNRVEYIYDDMGRVKTKVDKYIDPVTLLWVTVNSKSFKYDSSGNVVKELDALGYDAGSGTTVDSKINTGYGTEYTYNLAGKVYTVTDPVSQEKALPFTSKNEYDGLGRKISETNANGVITTYNYDDAGNILNIKVKKDEYSQEQIIKTDAYDLAGRQKTSTDANGNVTTFEYNLLSKLRKMVTPGDATITSNTVTFQYDVVGNLKLKQDSTGKVNLYTYDNQVRVLSQAEQKNGGTEVITMSAKYDKNGNKRFKTNGNGVTTENEYDELNRPIKTKVTVSGVLKTTIIGYDANGNQTTQTDWTGNISENKYDPLNRVIEKKDPYTTIQKLEYNRNNLQVKSYDALGYYTEFVYDRNNRLIITIDPEGHTVSQSYDNVGNTSSKTDGRNITTIYSYDKFNRLQLVSNAKSETTSYFYDLNGNMLTQTDGAGNVTTYEYNVSNKPVKKTDHSGRIGEEGSYTYIAAKTESYTYYANGTLKTKVDRNGETTNFTYDIHGRLTSQVVSGDSISYTYDNNGNQLTMVDSTGTTTRTYDEVNRVKAKSVPGIGTTTFNYDIISGVDAGFTVEKSTDPKNNITTKVYDKAGRLKYVYNGDLNSTDKTTYEYFNNGSRKSVVYQDGAREDYTYYKDGLNKTLVNKKADSTVIDSYSYEYDAAHNQTKKIDGKGTTINTYDSLNRLETVTEPTGKVTAYTFDKAGNRATESVTLDGIVTITTYAYNEQNRLMSTTTTTGGITEKIVYDYDGNGNMVSKSKSVTEPDNPGLSDSMSLYRVGESTNTDVTLFEYDKRNQLTKTLEGDKTVSYKYNGEGLRVEKTLNGDVTKYLYEYDKIVLEVDGTGNQAARNVYGTNLLSRSVDGEKLYYMYNGHADVTALIGANGQVVITYYYDTFGNVVENTGTKDNPIRYAGYQYDDDTELYYLNARMYDPKIARFLQEDTYRGTANDPLSLNLYTYVLNNPLRYYDPTGHWSEEERQTAIDAGWDSSDIEEMDRLTSEWLKYDAKLDSLEVDSLYLEKEYSRYLNLRDDQNKLANGIRGKYKSTNEIGGNEESKGMSNPMSEEEYEGLLQYVIDYRKELAGNMQYVYDPWNWQDELQNNIKPVIDMIPSDLSDEMRIPIVDAIDIAEAQTLQAKYLTVYTASDNVISKYVTERGLHQGLAPLFEQYPRVEKNINPLAKAFFAGFADGFHAGVWYSAFLSSSSKAESTTEYARRVGKAGEQAAGIVKNTKHIDSITGTASYRIPDGLDDINGLIQEVKNVRYQGLTNQIKDFVQYAKREGYTFELYIRPDTQISSPLQKLIDAGEIIIKHLK